MFLSEQVSMSKVFVLSIYDVEMNSVFQTKKN